MRIFRWDYIATRLIVLMALYLCSEYGVALAVRMALIYGGQSVVGAKVEVDRVDASLLRTRLAIGRVQVADPKSPMQNLVEADSIELDFESAALLRRSATADRGAIHGLRFGTPRTTSGELERVIEELDEASKEPSWVTEAAAGYATDWLKDVEGRFVADAKEDLQSVRLAEELAEKWPAEYAALAAEGAAIRDEVQLAREQVKQAKQNPLRNVDLLRDLPARIKGYEKRIKDLNARMAALPQAVRADRERIAAARAHDEALIRERLSMENADAEALTKYLLGERVGEPVVQLVGWLRWARGLAPDKPQRQAVCGRGIDVLFPGCKQLPLVLVRRLELDGVASVAGRTAELSGVVTDFTTEPLLHGQPLKLAIDATGALPMTMRATINRTGDEPVDELIANCPAAPLPQGELGSGKKLGLSIGPSTASFAASLRLVGDRLEGDIQIQQTQVRIASHVQGDLGPVSGATLTSAVDQSLGRLDSLVTRVTLSGTLDDPEWKVWSTLGPAVAEAFDRALRGALQEQADKLTRVAHERLDAELAKLDGKLSEAQQRATAALAEPAEKLKALIAGSAQQALGGGSAAALGERLLGGALKR